MLRMTKFNKGQLKTLEKLCKIPLDAREEEILLANLNKILAHIEQLNEVDTENVKPCNHVIKNTKAPLREDEPERLIPRDQFLKSTPEHIGGMVKVPKVIKDQF